MVPSSSPARSTLIPFKSIIWAGTRYSTSPNFRYTPWSSGSSSSLANARHWLVSHFLSGWMQAVFLRIALPSASSPWRFSFARKCPSPSVRWGKIRRVLSNCCRISAATWVSHHSGCPEEKPFRRNSSPGSTREKSGCSCRKCPMTLSFSSGEKVQVEYTISPPGAHIIAACPRISSCLSAQIRTCSGDHSSLAASSLRNIPSPEQGASTMILSKKAGNNAAICAVFSFSTTPFRMPMRSKFWDSTLALAG